MVTRDQRHTRPIRISHVQIRIRTSPSQVKRKKQLKNKTKRHNYFSQPIDKAKKMCYNNLRLKIKQVKNQHFRGVAQLVARQFRVLEAASSSPATSTKKTDIPFGMSVFFVLVSPRIRYRYAVASSHTPPVDRQACLSGEGGGYIRKKIPP